MSGLDMLCFNFSYSLRMKTSRKAPIICIIYYMVIKWVYRHERERTGPGKWQHYYMFVDQVAFLYVHREVHGPTVVLQQIAKRACMKHGSGKMLR